MLTLAPWRAFRCVGLLAAWLTWSGRAGAEPAPAGTAAPPAAVPPGPAAALSPASGPPVAGYAWDVLARLAAANCSEAKALLLEAQAELCEAATESAWGNPQLHLGRQWDGRGSDDESIGLRFYPANPFVSRWLRRQGAASAQAREAQAAEEAYAVFCEVRTLCLEAELAREDVALLEQMAALRAQRRDVRREESQAGVASPLELIRAETRLVSLRSDICGQQTARQRLLRRIAVLAGVPVAQVRLQPRPTSPPVAPGWLDAAVLTELAFARRPDLARAEHEKTAAAHHSAAAQARRVPWLRYVEGSYAAEENESEWEVRAVAEIPVADWLGDRVRRSRAELAAAETRVRGLYETVRLEVAGVLEDYRSASAERDRLVADCEQFSAAMSARIAALAQEPTVGREDVLQAREELVAYRRACLKAEREWLRLAQYLETVSGGSLAEAPPGQGPGATPAPRQEEHISP